MFPWSVFLSSHAKRYSWRVCLHFLCVHNLLPLHTIKELSRADSLTFFFEPLLVSFAEQVEQTMHVGLIILFLFLTSYSKSSWQLYLKNILWVPASFFFFSFFSSCHLESSISVNLKFFNYIRNSRKLLNYFKVFPHDKNKTYFLTTFLKCACCILIGKEDIFFSFCISLI